MYLYGKEHYQVIYMFRLVQIRLTLTVLSTTVFPRIEAPGLY